jgi:putative NADH-flavin reductase
LKIVLFVATGRNGRLLVDQVLAAGYEVTGVGTGLRIKRADVARFTLEALADVSYVRQAPMVSN